MRSAAIALIIGSILSLPQTGSAATAERERILLPVQAVMQPGAFGSIWNTTTSIYNAGGSSVMLFLPPTGAAREIAPGATITDLHAGAVEVSADEADAIYIRTILRNVADPLDVGTAVSSVRPSGWQTGALRVAGVPIIIGARYRLRVFSTSESVDLISVDVIDSNSGHTVFSSSGHLDGALPWSRSEFDLGDPTSWSGADENARLVVRAEDDGAPLYALLSTTDNVTQRVLLLTSDR
ncbi:MAG: hypothetical protein WBX15_02125 [Thermoanaerobaculia bacterium]